MQEEWVIEAAQPVYNEIAGYIKGEAKMPEPYGKKMLGEFTGGKWVATEYHLYMVVGGPAVRVRGRLEKNKPTGAILEVTTWFRPWTQFYDCNSEVLLAFARSFPFEEDETWNGNGQDENLPT